MSDDDECYTWNPNHFLPRNLHESCGLLLFEVAWSSLYHCNAVCVMLFETRFCDDEHENEAAVLKP